MHNVQAVTQLILCHIATYSLCLPRLQAHCPLGSQLHVLTDPGFAACRGHPFPVLPSWEWRRSTREKVLMLSVWNPLMSCPWAKTKRTLEEDLIPVPSGSYIHGHPHRLPSNLSEHHFCCRTREEVKRSVLTWGPHIQWASFVHVNPGSSVLQFFLLFFLSRTSWCWGL